MQGNCYWKALQLVQDYGTEFDEIPSYFEDHGLDFAALPSMDIHLVHGRLSTLPKDNSEHAWIEIDQWVVDYANKSKIIQDRESYYQAHDVLESTSVGRELFFAICKSNPVLTYWGDYDQDWFSEIQREHGNPVTPWKRIDFLLAYKEDRNPFSIL